jgi:hypothetical protein
MKRLLIIAAVALRAFSAQAEHPAAMLGTWHDRRADYTFKADGTAITDKHVYKLKERWDVNGDILTWGQAKYRLLLVDKHQLVYQWLNNPDGTKWVATMQR